MAFSDKVHITPNARRWWGVAPGDTLEVFDTDSRYGYMRVRSCYALRYSDGGKERTVGVPEA